MVRPILIALQALGVSGCSVRDPAACSVRCGAAAECPNQMVCGADSYCYGSDETPGTCAFRPDAGSDTGDDDAGGELCDPCDPVAQCGCEDGEGCYVETEGTTACELAGDRTQDQTCSTDGSCAAGYDCVSSGSGGKHCQEYCDDDLDCDGEVALCNREATGGTARVCTSDCDPMSSSGCRTDRSCVLDIGEDDRFDVNCRIPGAGLYLDSCVDQLDCGEGLLCVTTAGSGTYCRYVCEIGGFDCGGGTCGPLDPPAWVGDIEYGVCPF
jgi:hypothetical protein